MHLHLPAADGSFVDWAGLASLLAASGTRLRLDDAVGDPGRAEPALSALAARLRAAGIVPEAVAAFPSEPACLHALRHAFPGVSAGAGTEHFFAQLQRTERLGRGDFLTFTTSAIVHGTGEEEVMLTLQALPSMVATLQTDHSGPIRIGPSTIGTRASPLGRHPDSDGTRRITLAREDPRCRGLFGAAWVLGYVAACVRTGVEAVTLMSLDGASRIMASSRGEPPARYPVFHVLARLGAATEVRDLDVSEPTRVSGLVLYRAGTAELLLCNLGAAEVTVDLSAFGPPGDTAIMDAHAWAIFTSSPGDPWEAVRRPADRGVQAIGPFAVLSCRWAPDRRASP